MYTFWCSYAASTVASDLVGDLLCFGSRLIMMISEDGTGGAVENCSRRRTFRLRLTGTQNHMSAPSEIPVGSSSLASPLPTPMSRTHLRQIASCSWFDKSLVSSAMMLKKRCVPQGVSSFFRKTVIPTTGNMSFRILALACLHACYSSCSADKCSHTWRVVAGKVSRGTTANTNNMFATLL